MLDHAERWEPKALRCPAAVEVIRALPQLLLHAALKRRRAAFRSPCHWRGPCPPERQQATKPHPCFDGLPKL